MKFIHSQSTWPCFQWDASYLAQLLAELRHKQGRILGKMDAFGFELKSEANLCALTEEVIKTSQIENEHLNSLEVRSSIARRLGLESAGMVASSREVDGVVENYDGVVVVVLESVMMVKWWV